MQKSIVVFAALAIVCACKKNETAQPASTTTQSTMTTATAAAPPPAQPTTQTTASATPAPGTIASTDGEEAGTHIDVTEFKRSSGNTISLKFVLANNGSEKFGMWGHKLGDHENRTDYKAVGGIHLVDAANKKKYFVVRDSEGNCVCSREVADVPPGGKANLWAKFPAPPPDVQKITIEIPHFQPMDDVPIGQ
jgi:hypothetical protein